MLSKRTFLLTTLAASGGLLAPLPALSGRADHPYRDHPFNNPPFTVWLGDIRVELILPFFPELDPDGYPVGEPARFSYSIGGNELTSMVRFAAKDLRNFGDTLIKGGTFTVAAGGRTVKGALNLNDKGMSTLTMVSGNGQKAMLGAGKGKAAELQDLSAGATNAQVALSFAVGMLAAMNDGKAAGDAVLTASSKAGTASMKVEMKMA